MHKENLYCLRDSEGAGATKVLGCDCEAVLGQEKQADRKAVRNGCEEVREQTGKGV